MLCGARSAHSQLSGKPCRSPIAHTRKILEFYLDLRLRRWHPAKLRGRSVSSAFSCISFHKAEGTAGTFSARKFPEQIQIKSENAFLKSPAANLAHQRAKPQRYNKPGLNSRNSTNIASPCKHRQPMFLHPNKSGRNKSNQCDVSNRRARLVMARLRKVPNQGIASAMPPKGAIRDGFSRRGLPFKAKRPKPAHSGCRCGMPEGMA